MLRRPSYEDLEEEIKQLRSELGWKLETEKVDAIRKGLGITPSEAKLVLALYQAKGAMRVDLLDRVCGRFEGSCTSNATAIRVGKVRTKHTYEFIDTHKGFGYALSWRGRERVDELLKK